MDALRGILLTSFADHDLARARKRWDRASGHLAELLRPMLG